MTANFDSFKLYDTNIINLLCGIPDDILEPGEEPEHQGVFEGLREPELICAIYQKNYSRLYRKLDKLEKPLPPKDAMAACLCALNGTKRLMNRVLDHCPPLPQFQFQGVGSVSSLVEVAARQDRIDMLDILLKRGANPNRGTDDAMKPSPLESAFRFRAYLCLQRLLAESTLDLNLTEQMLSVWGELRESANQSENGHAVLHLWSCQLLYERLTGECVPFFEPIPLPEKLRLRHALEHNNLELAIRICQERPLDDQDKETIRTYFAARCVNRLLEANSSEWLVDSYKQQGAFLVQILEHYPDLLETPEIRQGLVSVALALPQVDEQLQGWVEQMADGVVQMSNLPMDSFFEDDFLAQLLEQRTVEMDFFSRWEERLGNRLIPALHRNTQIEGLRKRDVQLLLQRVVFTGATTPGKLSNVAVQALTRAPEELLPELLREGGLLAQEDANDLLNACQDLPLSRRNRILPYIRKEAVYAL